MLAVKIDSTIRTTQPGAPKEEKFSVRAGRRTLRLAMPRTTGSVQYKASRVCHLLASGAKELEMAQRCQAHQRSAT